MNIEEFKEHASVEELYEEVPEHPNAIIRSLMEHDGMEMMDAVNYLEECREMVENGEDPEEVLLYELGLEPDYLLDLIW